MGSHDQRWGMDCTSAGVVEGGGDWRGQWEAERKVEEAEVLSNIYI